MSNLRRPRVTVVVPSKNRKNTIVKLLHSLRHLDYPNYEVLIADSSTDGTDEICKKYGFKVLSVPHHGVNIARNMGIKNASGEIIAFTDSDCEVSEKWLTQIVSVFENSPDVSVVGGSVHTRVRSFWESYADETVVPIFPKYTQPILIEKSNPFDGKRYPVGCNVAFRRSVFEQNGGFDEDWKKCWDEFEFLYRLVIRGHLIYVDPKIVVYHHHRSSLTALLRQVYRYGMGASHFEKTFQTHKFKDRLKNASANAIRSIPHAVRLCYEKRKLSALVYPAVDLLVCISYYFGVASEVLSAWILPKLK